MHAADASASFVIAELPDELFLTVFDFLKPIRGFLASETEETSRRDENRQRVQGLYGLSLTCRRVHDLTQPVLYQSFIQPGWDHRAACFLRTLLQSPSLANHIQYVESSRPNEMPPISELELQQKPNSRLHRLFHLLRAPDWQDRERNSVLQESYTSLLQKYEARSPAFELSAIIALSPKLVDIAVAQPSQLLLGTLHMKSYTMNYGLQNMWIKVLPEEGLYEFCYWIPTAVVEACIPIGRQLWLSGATSTATNIWLVSVWTHPHPMGEPIEEIVLDTCEMLPERMDALLSSRTGMKRFTCRWGKYSDNTRSQPINLPMLARSLAKFSHTLESLILDTLESSWQVSMDMDIPPIGSLREFTLLKNLDVSGLVLWGDHDDEKCEHPPLASILPESLEKLMIRSEWDVHLSTFICDFPENGPSPIPNLRYLDCSWRPIDHHDAEWMVSILASCGVELHVQGSKDL